MAENWIKIKESLYKGAFLRNEKRGSSSESSSNRDWAEGELFRQEPLSIEIRNGTLETGNLTEVGEDGRLEMGNGKREKWTLDIGLEQFWMGNWPEHKHNECELTESNPAAFYQLSAELDNTLITLRFFWFFCWPVVTMQPVHCGKVLGVTPLFFFRVIWSHPESSGGHLEVIFRSSGVI